MPVTFTVATHKAEPVGEYTYYGTRKRELDARTLLKGACHQEYPFAGTLRGSSFDEIGPVANVQPGPNGFFHTVARAYNNHHALVLRPDDVWLAILVQFNFFLNGPGNAERLRALFVSHDDKRQLRVVHESLEDFGSFAREMVGEIEKSVVDPTLRAWALPNFSTTTERDTTVASVVLMATLKSYFDYAFCCIMCGIPRVTLLGDKADWENVRARADKLKEYGVETIAWHHMLVPVLTRFVRSFEEPDSDATRAFWGQPAHFQSGGSGPSTYTGWLTAFCVFDEHGRWQGSKLKDTVEVGVSPDTMSAKEFFTIYLEHHTTRGPLILDDTSYFALDAQKIPPCYAHVDVLLVNLDTGEEWETAMIAGVIATEELSSGEERVSEKGENDIVQPMAGWWLFEKKERAEEGTAMNEQKPIVILAGPPGV
ncbi:hypothetical protein MKEN_00958300 [Mycena kentingensis (nom. inval.)]|nr:hypothetical protein MKEN_00958300 [Mycena kentingensis (nom. inval.)]